RGAAGSAASWFGHRQRAVQQQRLRPAGEVLGGKHQLQPDGVAPPTVEWQIAQARGLSAADAVLDAGALPVAQLKGGDVGVGLVDLHPERDPSGMAARGPGQPGAAPGAAAWYQHRPVTLAAAGSCARARLTSSTRSRAPRERRSRAAADPPLFTGAAPRSR